MAHNAQSEPLPLDADLEATIEKARGTALFKAVLSMAQTRQAERNTATGKADAKAAAFAALPPQKRRRAVARERLETAQSTPADIRHIHSVLAVCGLPYTKPKGDLRRFERKQGNMSLVVHAGELLTPSGSWQAQPLPYGPKARLIFMHLCTEAVRQKSATIDIADSFTAFVRELGFDDAGGPRGALTSFKRQLNALAACNLTLGTWNGTSAKTSKFSPIEQFDIWLSNNPNQKSLWPSTLTFSSPMFESLKKHALPVNAHAVRAFRNSARMLDLYFWVGYRVHNTKEKLHISWEALEQQFGEGFSRPRDFRARFAAEVNYLTEVLPRVPLHLGEKGIILQPAGPEVLALPPRRLIK